MTEATDRAAAAKPVVTTVGVMELELPTRSGLVLRADGYGDPAHRSVILAHGGGQTRHSWTGTAQVLARAGWHAVAYDQRGHGTSDRAADQDYSGQSFATDCIDVCAQFHDSAGRAPVLVGASLGGLSGMLAEGSIAPGTTSALVLVDVTPRMERAGIDRIVSFMLDRVETGFADLEEAADAIAAYQPHRPRPPDLSGLAKNLRQDPDGRWRWHWDPDLFMGPTPLGTDASAQRFDDAAEGLRVPTLLVRGAMSDLVSEETVRHFLELCPAAQFVDVSGAGHMVAGDRNDAFTAAVVAFLATLD